MCCNITLEPFPKVNVCCSWFSAATGLVSFVLFFPFIFKENFISERELEALRKEKVGHLLPFPIPLLTER